jgi:adenosylmethionine-8-amino-7-oxononanoate aminotransferase
VGLLWALELVRPGTREPLDTGTLGRVAAAIKRRHLHLHRRDNLVYLAPPLVATEEDLDLALTLLGEALDEVFGAAPGAARGTVSAIEVSLMSGSDPSRHRRAT